MADETFGLTANSAPAPGQSLPSIGTSPPGEVMNVAATFVPTPPSVPANTGQRAAALKKCRKKHSAKARKRCRKKANLLPV